MRPYLAAVLCAPLLLAACSGGSGATATPTASSVATATSTAPSAATATPTAPSAATATPTAPSAATATPTAPSAATRPSIEGMPTDRLADAVLEQLKIDSPDTFTDQLITIALSPLMRQLSSTADVTTRVDSDGPQVKLTLAGMDSTCIVTVTDDPRARGVVCKPV